jgi:small-conductance mechanosensitive channel
LSFSQGDATIEDVLRFRRALAFMDEVHPFGEDFGLASTRDEAIASAEKVYHELCKIGTHKRSLPFDTIAMIALEDDDTHDQTKRRALRRLFHPDKDNVLTLLAFVQSCDALYRRLRYFLATVKNSVSLDRVLENVLNSIYYFVLTLFLLSLMNYNAWGLLVSMTSLLVSFSFAFGQTVSKYVQGIILIAVTRPFDLGDRVFLTPAGDVERGLENAGNGFFVEDITLSSTKLRFARTGEVAYIANNLLADMRIYNCNRSPNASVVIQPVVHICALEKDNMKKFEEALRKYVAERPRQWAELLIICIVKVDSDFEQVHLMIAFRHRDSWQNTARIYKQRGELMEYVHNVTKRLGIVFESPPPRRVLYMGGQLEQGAVAGGNEVDHRTDLLRPKNVRSTSITHERSASESVPLSPLDKMLNP